jgi:hypothetical protein
MERVTDKEFVCAAPAFITSEPAGGVASRAIVSLHAVEMFPAASLNTVYTVFVPSPLVSVHALDAENGSHGSVSNTPSLLIRIWETPERASVAVKVSVDVVELVYAASESTFMVQLTGGVVSTWTLIPAEGVSTLAALSVARVLIV